MAAAFVKKATLSPSLSGIMQSPFTIKPQKVLGPDEKPSGMLKFSKPPASAKPPSLMTPAFKPPKSL